MRPGPRRSISQSDIVDTAFRLLEEKGFAAVSIRGVAAALGLTPTAMYTYFASKNALLRAMVEELLSTLDLGAASAVEAPWRDRVTALAGAVRTRLAAHAGSMVLVTSGPLDGRNALGLSEVLIAGFAGEGLPRADAARSARAVWAYVLGVAAVDAAERAGEADNATRPSSGEALWTDAAAFPLTAATVDAARADDGFGWGLDRLLDGLLAAVPAAR